MSITATFLGFSNARFNQFNRDMDTTLRRLSTGVKIGRPTDGPAAFVSSLRLDAEQAAFQTANYNSQRAAVFTDTTAGYLSDALDNLQAARALVAKDPLLQGLTDQAELDALLDNVDAIGDTASFAGRRLFVDAVPPVIEEIDVTPPPLEGEVMKFNRSQTGAETYYSRNFTDTIDDAVVIAAPPTYNGYQQEHMRLRNVTDAGFEYNQEEWDYLDGSHTTETLGFLALSAGSYTLDDGTRIEVGRATVDHTGGRVVFDRAFEDGNAPLVLTTVQTNNDPAAVNTLTSNVDATGFDVKLIEEANADGIHGVETVGYIAITAASGSLGGTDFVYGSVASAANGATTTASYGQTLSNAVVFANPQTSAEDEAADLRIRQLQNNQVRFEYDSAGGPGSNSVVPSEQIGFLAFDAPGTFSADLEPEFELVEKSAGSGGNVFAQSALRAEATNDLELGSIHTWQIGTPGSTLDQLRTGGLLDLAGDRATALDSLDAAISRVSAMQVQTEAYGKYTNASLGRIAVASEKAAFDLQEALTSINEAEEMATFSRLQMQQYGFDMVFAEMENSANRVMQLLSAAGGLGGSIETASVFGGAGASAGTADLSAATVTEDEDDALIASLQQQLLDQQAQIAALQEQLAGESEE